ncbi:unknown [Coprobacillus sp. CAG:605]|nr:unknown [Coprobacillus sp. CAG:605]
MKKTLLTILGAILVGFGLGLFFFKKFDTNIEALATSVKSIYAVQVGVYKNIDNAKEVANKMEGIVVLDNDYYRVYIDIIKDKEILNSREEYYKNNNINYYLKIINPSKEFITKLDDYEIILKNTSISADKIGVVREKILKEYQNELHD